MASGPITSSQIDEEAMEIVTDFIFLGSKITADSDCSHEIKNKNKKLLLLGRMAMTNLESVLKSRDITLPTKVHIVKTMVFPVVMYRYETWTIKKAESQRTDTFKLWCWRRLLRVPWTARKSSNGDPSSSQVEKAMAPHSSTLAWRIPWTEEPGGLQSMGSLGVGHD